MRIASLFLAIFSVTSFASTPALDSILAEHEAYAKSLCEAMTGEVPATLPVVFDGCQDNLLGNSDFGALSCDSRYGNTTHCSCSGKRVSFISSAVKYADGIDPAHPENVRFLKRTSLLLGQFKKNYANNTNVRWQYGCSDQGVFVGFPGNSWKEEVPGTTCPKAGSQCVSYDCRKRPYYVAGTSGPKEIVLLLDESGSMLEHGRMSLMKEAAKLVVDGLTKNDYASVVRFSSYPRACSFGYQMLQGTAENKAKMKLCIDRAPYNRRSTTETYFGTAFEKAFETLATSPESKPQKAILFLTDGIPDDSDFLAKVDSLNPNREVKIHVYALGSEVSDSKIASLKKLAASNKGIYKHVADGGNLAGQMAGYTRYYMHLMDPDGSTWSDVYRDFTTKETLVTVTHNCFQPVPGKNYKVVLGVAAVDVPLDPLLFFGNETMLGDYVKQRNSVNIASDISPEAYCCLNGFDAEAKACPCPLCDPGKTGVNCEIPICYGERADSEKVCNRAGECTDVDKCKCQETVVDDGLEFTTKGPKCEKDQLIGPTSSAGSSVPLGLMAAFVSIVAAML